MKSLGFIRLKDSEEEEFEWEHKSYLEATNYSQDSILLLGRKISNITEDVNDNEDSRVAETVNSDNPL